MSYADRDAKLRRLKEMVDEVEREWRIRGRDGTNWAANREFRRLVYDLFHVGTGT
jgi:hypothetical protein